MYLRYSTIPKPISKSVGELFVLTRCKIANLNTDTKLHSQLAGQQLSDIDLPMVMEELNKVCVKWYDIGMMLRVKLNRLDAIKEQYSNPSDCLRETLKMWL